MQEIIIESHSFNGSKPVLQVIPFDTSYNVALNVRTLGRKPAIGKGELDEGTNIITNARNVHFDNLQEFSKFLREGHTIYAGKFQKSAKNTTGKSVEKSGFIFIDVDDYSLQKFLTNPFVQKYCGIVHPSYRAIPEDVRKFHAYFQCDRSIKPEEYKPIWLMVVKYLGITLDSSKCGASNLSFGSPHDPVVLGQKYLAVDALLTEYEADKKAQKAAIKTPGVASKVEDSQTVTDRALRHIYDHIYVPILQEDPTLLYQLYSHSLTELTLTELDKEQGTTRKFDGSNPFSSTNSSKHSFVVSCKNGILPVFYDRSHTLKAINGVGDEVSGYHFLYYWYEMHKKHYAGDFKKCFKQVIKDVCDFFKAPAFEFQAPVEVSTIEITDFLKKYLADKVFRPKWDREHYFVFSSDDGTWNYITSGVDFYQELCFRPIEENFGTIVAENMKVINYVTKWSSVYPWDRLEYPEIEDINYVPFLNGHYNRKKGVLEEYQPKAYCSSRLPFDYREVADDNLSIVALKKHLITWLKDEELARFVFLWVILNCQREAYQTKITVGLLGSAGTGKTTFCEYLIALFHPHGFSKYAANLDADRLTSLSNNHSTAVLEDKYVVTLDEFKGNTANSSYEKLKSYTGKDKGTPSTVNPKGHKERQIFLRVAFTWNRQDMIQMNAFDAGFDRRNIIIELDKNKHKTPEAEASWKIIQQTQNLNDVFCWCQKQDTQSVIKEFLELCNLPVFTQFKSKTKFENNYIAQWCEENLVITNEPEDFIVGSDLFTNYLDYAKLNKTTEFGNRKFFLDLKKTLTDEAFGFGYTMSLESTVKKILGHPTRVYLGIKFKSAQIVDGF